MTDSMLIAAIEDLKTSIEKQVALQEETNTLLRRVIMTTAENSQELLELRQQMAKPKAAVRVPAAPPSGTQRRG